MNDATSAVDRWLLHAARHIVGPAPLRFALPSCVEELPASFSTVPAIRFAGRRELAAVLLNPESGFGDLYSEGRVQVEGDLVELLETLYQAPLPDPPMYRFVSRWLDWIQANTLRGSRRNIHQHYDLPTDFYSLWLDSQLAYTCAYFPRQGISLEEAQAAKLDLVSRKLRLRRGETVVEAGCGWGALALHMAKHYGVRVKAFNISHEQIALARERAQREGLAGEVEFIEDDYRSIKGKFDVFVSVGMLEHVGRAHYRDLGDVIYQSIGDRGRGLLHFIGRNQSKPLSAWIRKRIFPGAYVPSLREVMDTFEPHDFSVVDVENLRLHYATTLEHWLQRYQQSYDLIERRYGASFARMWRLYLAGSIAAFRVGTIQLFQVVFTGARCEALPWTRADLYQGEPARHEKDDRWIHAMS
jgi:cyclopropane-fatty-acyl-phospholipid synthase